MSGAGHESFATQAAPAGAPSPVAVPDGSSFAADAPFEPLPRRALLAMRLSALLGALPLLLGAGVLLLLVGVVGGELALAHYLLLVLLLACVLPAGAWLLAGARWRRTSWRLDRDGLCIRRGLVWRSETLVPHSRVQHVDINHGPIDRRFGLAALKVHTAGTQLSAVSLDGLLRERAEALRDDLVRDSEGDAAAAQHQGDAAPPHPAAAHPDAAAQPRDASPGAQRDD